MKFIMSQDCSDIVPINNVSRIYIDYSETKELYYLKIIVLITNNRDSISYVFGKFKTLDRAEEAMMMLMNVLEDEFWAKVVNDK